MVVTSWPFGQVEGGNGIAWQFEFQSFFWMRFSWWICKPAAEFWIILRVVSDFLSGFLVRWCFRLPRANYFSKKWKFLKISNLKLSLDNTSRALGWRKLISKSKAIFNGFMSKSENFSWKMMKHVVPRRDSGWFRLCLGVIRDALE